jgi:hypothetical protein
MRKTNSAPVSFHKGINKNQLYGVDLPEKNSKQSCTAFPIRPNRASISVFLRVAKVPAIVCSP